jgi:hypothetical protein
MTEVLLAILVVLQVMQIRQARRAPPPPVVVSQHELSQRALALLTEKLRARAALKQRAPD